MTRNGTLNLLHLQRIIGHLRVASTLPPHTKFCLLRLSSDLEWTSLFLHAPHTAVFVLMNKTQILAGLAEAEGIDWNKTKIYFADERCVPLEHSDRSVVDVWGPCIERWRDRPAGARENTIRGQNRLLRQLIPN